MIVKAHSAHAATPGHRCGRAGQAHAYPPACGLWHELVGRSSLWPPSVLGALRTQASVRMLGGRARRHPVHERSETATRVVGPRPAPVGRLIPASQSEAVTLQRKRPAHCAGLSCGGGSLARWVNAHEVYRADSTGRRNTLSMEVLMGTMRERQRAVQLYRGQIPSPGRPTVAWRQDRVEFWAAIAQGGSSEDAALEIGLSSAVGARWFRHAGGVNPSLAPTVPGRCLSRHSSEPLPRPDRRPSQRKSGQGSRLGTDDEGHGDHDSDTCRAGTGGRKGPSAWRQDLVDRVHCGKSRMGAVPLPAPRTVHRLIP
jgi:hypothetical protein